MALKKSLRNLSEFALNRVNSASDWTGDDDLDDMHTTEGRRKAYAKGRRQTAMEARKARYKFLPNQDVVLSRKYEHLRTIDNDNIMSKDNKLEALILLLKLPHIYKLPEHEQYHIVQQRYPWIDDEDGDIDQFQYEEIQEMVLNMVSIERSHIHDTIPDYDSVLHVLSPSDSSHVFEGQYNLKHVQISRSI